MELRHIRYFLALAEHLNFRKAAQRLYIAQPSLSRQIQQLEQELGVELFSRDKQHVELTKAGLAFVENARQLLAQAGHAVEAARQAQRGGSGIVKVGIASALGGVVGQVVCVFRARMPKVEIQCQDVFSSYQNDALRRCEIDVGFMRPPVDRLSLQCELLYEEGFVAILPKFHRLAKRRTLRMCDIADEPVIVFGRNFSNSLYDKILGLYSHNGFTPRLVTTNMEPHYEAGAVMVACGKAIFVGAGAFVNRSLAGLALVSIPLDEPQAKIEVYAAWRKEESSAAVHELVACARSTCQSPRFAVTGQGTRLRRR